MSASDVADTSTMSAECALAHRPGYEDLHAECRQTEDVPLPHSMGILLKARCRCSCHTLPADAP